MCVCSVASIISNSLRPYVRLLCLWDSPGKNTGVGCHTVLQGIFPTQGLNPHLLPLLHCRCILYLLSHLRSPMCVLVSQSCPTLCDSMDCSLVVHAILQARTLEWVAISFSRGSSQPTDWTQVSHIAGRFFTIWARREILLGDFVCVCVCVCVCVSCSVVSHSFGKTHRIIHINN